ncbi:MAG: EVE domain-containing protein [Candidatus Eremiobacteraeota bacterium]|nr:EVE domain-containing protein [Candidatus Eremiobacteraeota bacterium]
MHARPHRRPLRKTPHDRARTAVSRYWLLKTEPSGYSFERLRAEGTTPWTGVRNFQARNNMMEMRLGDLALFYHSSVAKPAAVGICRVVREAHADFTQFDRESEYFDGRAKPSKPIWFMVDVAYVEALANPVTLAQMRAEPRLLGMALLRRGQRLSVQPVMPHEWKIVLELSRLTPAPA